jgi:hypothetical protein
MPIKSDCAGEAKDHLSRRRNIEGLLLATFGLAMCSRAAPKFDVLRLGLLESSRPRTA